MLSKVSPVLIAFFSIFLFVGPLLGPLFTRFLDRHRGKELAPFMPQLNTYSFGQAIIILVASLTIAWPSEWTQGILIVAIFLFVTLVFFLIQWDLSDQEKENKTKEHVTKILDEHVRDHLKDNVDFEELKNLAFALIEEDLLPNSRTQMLSGYPRQKRREQFVKLINSHFCNELPQILTQEHFLLPVKEREVINRRYKQVVIVSCIFYAVFVGLFLWVSITQL